MRGPKGKSRLKQLFGSSFSLSAISFEHQEQHYIIYFVYFLRIHLNLISHVAVGSSMVVAIASRLQGHLTSALAPLILRL